MPIQIQNTLGPPGTITGGVDPNASDNQPTGDGSQAVNQANQGVVNNNAGSDMDSNSINTISISAYDNLVGRMGLSADQFTAQGEFSILGQKPVGLSPSVMRASNEFSDLMIDAGSAIRSSEGWALPATGNSTNDEGNVFHKGSVIRTVSVPSDVTTEEVSVNALLSLGGVDSSSGHARVSVKIECLDTGSKYSKNVTIPASTIRKNRFTS